LVAILFSYAYFSFRDPNPGLLNLFPVLGCAALLLFADSRRGIGRLLSFAPLVYVGRISYPLYLFHWIVFVYANYALFSYNRTSIKLMLIAMSFALSAIVFHFIENPIRHRVIVSQKRLLAGFSILLIAGLAFGAVLRLGQGFPERYSSVPFVRDAWSADFPKLSEGQLADGKAAFLYRSDASVGTVALAGDSHACMYADVIRRVAAAEGRSAILYGKGGFDPFPGMGKITEESWLRMLSDFNVDQVFLACRWDGKVEMAKRLIPALKILAERGVRTYIVLQPPVHRKYHVARTAAVGLKFGCDGLPLPRLEDHRSYRARLNHYLHSLSEKYGLIILDTEPYFFDSNGTGLLLSGNKLLYRDQSHLTIDGCVRLERLFQAAMLSDHGDCVVAGHPNSSFSR
jgi:hypothetical protein